MIYLAWLGGIAAIWLVVAGVIAGTFFKNSSEAKRWDAVAIFLWPFTLFFLSTFGLGIFIGDSIRRKWPWLANSDEWDQRKDNP